MFGALERLYAGYVANKVTRDKVIKWLEDVAEKSAEQHIPVNKEFYIDVGKVFSRQFALALVPALNAEPPKPKGHPKAILLKKIDLPSNIVVGVYLVSFPEDSKRWKALKENKQVIAKL